MRAVGITCAISGTCRRGLVRGEVRVEVRLRFGLRFD